MIRERRSYFISSKTFRRLAPALMLVVLVVFSGTTPVGLAGTIAGSTTDPAHVTGTSRLSVAWSDRGMRVTRGSDPAGWVVEVAAFGRAGAMSSLPRVPPRVLGGEALYEWSGLRVRYESGSRGVEQVFELPVRPPGTPAPAVIRLSSDRDLVAEPDGSIAISGPGEGPRLRYGEIAVRDAEGRSLPAAIALRDPTTIELRLDETSAVYPVVVDPLVWQEQSALVPSDPAYQDELGAAVAVEGSLAIVGAPYKTEGPNQYAGAVYVFAKSASGWTEQQELQPSDPTAYALFGSSVALRDGTLLVGTPTDIGVAGDHTGAVYVFTEGSSGSFTQTAKLVPNDPSDESLFGTHVAVSDGFAAITADAPLYQSGTGTVYLFTYGGSSWSQTQELTPGSDATIGGFGSSVSLSGTTLAVGSAGTSVGSDYCAGSVEIYVDSSSVWSLQTKLGPSETPTQGDDFGLSVALDGNTLVVGAPHECSGASGSAAVFTQSGTSWSLAQGLAADTPATNDRFGASTAISGSTAVVGMPRCPEYGAACSTTQVPYGYLFTGTESTWTLQQRIAGADVVSGDSFGAAVAIDGATVVVGAPDKTTDAAGTMAGSAYVFQFASANGDSCSTGGTCASGFCADGVCCDSACGSACDVCAKALGATSDGACTAAPSASAGAPSCGPYACDGTHVTCPTACTGDANCASSDYCAADGQCHAMLPQGTRCNLSAGAACLVANCRACATSSCVDGVCCNTDCGGACDACSAATGSSADGTCTVLPVGSLGSPSCAPYACDGQNAVCPGQCGSDADCGPGQYCAAGGRCNTQEPQGNACAAADCQSSGCHECAGSFQCVDGYCCNDACNGPCEACNTADHLGDCVPVQGAPIAPRPTCGGTGACSGACDGNSGGACAYPSQGTTCLAASCNGNASQPPSVCDGAGECVTPVTVPCGTYACDAAKGGCRTTCQSDADCSPGSSCDTTRSQCAGATNTCNDAYSIRTPNGQISSCGGFRCQAGACQSTCLLPSDCADGYTCASPACVPDAAVGPTPSMTATSPSGSPASSSPEGSKGGCACHLSGGTDSGSAPPGWLVLLLLVPFVRRASRAYPRLCSGDVGRYGARVKSWILLALVAGLGAGCGASDAIARRPEVETNDPNKVFVLGWDSTDRAVLDGLVKHPNPNVPSGIAVVARSGRSVTLLSGCSFHGDYLYTVGGGGLEEQDRSHADQLAATVPFFKSLVGGDVERGDELHLRLKTAGFYQAPTGNFHYDNIDGSNDCKERATDVIRLVVVGAYELGTKDHALVNFGLKAAGEDLANLKSSTNEADHEADGLLLQCDDDSDAGAPVRKCQALLSIELEPIVDAPRHTLGDGQRTTGEVVGGLGLLGIAAGGVAGVLALATYSDAQNACPAHVGCSGAAANTASSATTKAYIADFAIGGGLVALAAGAYLYLSAPHIEAPPRRGTLQVSPSVGPQFAGASLDETF